MSWLRLVGIQSAILMALGCGNSRSNLAAGSPPPADGPKLLTPTGAPQIVQTSDKSDIQRTSHVLRPALASATKAEFGLPEPQGPITASVVARVNGQPILFQELLASTGQSKPDAQTLQQELERMIDREVVLHDAYAKVRPQSLAKVKDTAERDFEAKMRKQKAELKMTSEEEFRQYLEKQGYNWTDLQRQHERSYMFGEYMRNLVKPKIDGIDREMMLEYYQKNRKDFDKPERVTWQVLFVDVDRCTDGAEARQRADLLLELAQHVKSQEEFTALAKEHGHGVVRENALGEGNERGSIRPEELEEVLFNLRPGDIGPLIEVRGGLNSQYVRGYHVVRLIDHQPAGRVPFEQACSEIRNKLRNQIGRTEWDKIIKELRSKAHIENALAK